MTSPDEVWDAGLQPERTGLAWQRAALAFLGLGLALPKLAWPALGAWAVPPAALVVAGAISLFLIAHRRYRATHDTLTRSRSLRNGGRLVLTATVLSLLLALVAAVLVAAAALGRIG